MRSRLALLLMILAAGCADDPPPGPELISCESPGTAETSAPSVELDVILVVSEAPGMAAYRAALISNLTVLGDELSGGGLPPSLRIGVLDAGGALTAAPRLPGCVATEQPVLEDLDLPWFWCAGAARGECRSRNYQGTLAEALPCIGAVEADGVAAPPLLARLDAVLDSDLLRPDAYLVVLLIGVDDDASSGDPDDYADRLLASRSDPRKVLIARVGGPSAPRLDAFAARFPERATAASIEGADWSGSFLWFVRDDLALYGCLDVARLRDRDPDADGLQPDCVAAEHDGGAAIPPCLMVSPDRPDPATPLPCLWIHPPSWELPECTLQATVERRRAGGLAEVRCACQP